MRNKQLLVITKDKVDVLEECHGTLLKTTIQMANIISSPCKLIIGNNIYSNTTPSYEIKIPKIRDLASSPGSNREIEMHPIYLNSPQELTKISATQQNHSRDLQRALHFTNLSVSTICILLLATSTFLLFRYRRRIHEIFCKPKTIIQLQDIAVVVTAAKPTSNEDARS